MRDGWRRHTSGRASTRTHTQAKEENSNPRWVRLVGVGVSTNNVLTIQQDKYTGDSCLCGHQAAARVSGVSISMSINQSHVADRPITAGHLLLGTKQRGTLGFAFHKSYADHLGMVL